jgi:arginine exporter protein ArgO
VNAAILAGLLAGYGIAIPVGAVTTYIVALSARTSLRIGASAALGVATADGLYALVAVLGGSSLGAAIAPIAVPLRWASAFVLFGLAARSALTAVRGFRGAPDSATGAGADERPALARPARAYLGLVGLTLLNPTTVVYFAALVLGTRTVSATDRPDQAAFVLAAFTASASWQLLIATGGTLLGRALTTPRARFLTAIASSTLIAALAVRVVWSA